MANAYTKFRTNYVKFTDKCALREYKNAVEDAVASDGPLVIYTQEYKDYCEIMFGAHGSLLGYPVDENDDECEDYNYDAFIETLQKLLPDGEALIITTIGDEKLRYVYGNCDVITKDKRVVMNLNDIAIDKARDMLENPEWTTRNDY